MTTGPIPPAPPFRRLLQGFLCVLAAACAGRGAEAGAQDLGRCEAAERYLSGTLGMIAEIGPDTLDDWRTDRMVPACRVTAAGSTPLEMEDVAENLYAGLFATGWERTPDPQDAPAESSYRLRQGETDCLFSFYHNIALGTPEEFRVTSALVIPPGEKRFNVIAQCVPAMEASG